MGDLGRRDRRSRLRQPRGASRGRSSSACRVSGGRARICGAGDRGRRRCARRRAPGRVARAADRRHRLREAMAHAAAEFFGRPTERARDRGRHRDERQDDDRLPALLDPRARGPQAGLLGTIESRIGGERRAAIRTTPEAIDLQRAFREMLDAGDRSAAMEATSHGSEQNRLLEGIRFSVARLHEPEPGPPRPPRDDGELLRGEAAAVRRGASSGCDQHRRSVGPQARRRRGRTRSSPSASPTTPSWGRRRSTASTSSCKGRFNVENILGAASRRPVLGIDDERDRRRARGARGRPRTVRERRRGATVHGPRRLRAHARVARERAGGSPRARLRQRDLRLRLRRRPRPREAPADGRDRRASSPTSRSSPPTTRAARSRGRSSTRSWPAPRARSRSIRTAGRRSRAPSRSPSPATSSSSRARATSRVSSSATEQFPSMTEKWHGKP